MTDRLPKTGTGKVALVAGATRGAGRGIAVELGLAGFTVYVTGRSTRLHRSEMNRPETIEETADIIKRAGGHAIAVQVDHLVPGQVRDLTSRIEREQGRLDVLVNDIWGSEDLVHTVPIWEQRSLEAGLHLLRLQVDTHLITSHYALALMVRKPGGLLIEVTDGTWEYNSTHYRVSLFYDLAKVSINRIAWTQAQDLQKAGCTAVSLTPGWIRSEWMLDHFGVTEANWRDAIKADPVFADSESPRFVGRAAASLALDPDVARWNGQSLSSAQLSRVYGFRDLDGSQPDCWSRIS